MLKSLPTYDRGYDMKTTFRRVMSHQCRIQREADDEPGSGALPAAVSAAAPILASVRKRQQTCWPPGAWSHQATINVALPAD
eukprot:scaffold6789_cov206-Skeletonema_marinoi.AAC.10